MNLLDGLKEEIKRCKELREMYLSIPAGAFGAKMLERDIAAAERALEDNDVVAMVTSCKILQGCQ